MPMIPIRWVATVVHEALTRILVQYPGQHHDFASRKLLAGYSHASQRLIKRLPPKPTGSGSTHECGAPAVWPRFPGCKLFEHFFPCFQRLFPQMECVLNPRIQVCMTRNRGVPVQWAMLRCR